MEWYDWLRKNWQKFGEKTIGDGDLDGSVVEVGWGGGGEVIVRDVGKAGLAVCDPELADSCDLALDSSAAE